MELDKNKRYYLSHPYTSHGDKEKNLQDAKRIELALKGEYDLDPGVILNTIFEVWCLRVTEEEQAWKLCRAYYEICDAVILCNNWWKSKGCRKEVRWALADGKPIYLVISNGEVFTTDSSAIQVTLAEYDDAQELYEIYLEGREYHAKNHSNTDEHVDNTVDSVSKRGWFIWREKDQSGKWVYSTRRKPPCFNSYGPEHGTHWLFNRCAKWLSGKCPDTNPEPTLIPGGIVEPKIFSELARTYKDGDLEVRLHGRTVEICHNGDNCVLQL
jgi:hypothetical protein